MSAISTPQYFQQSAAKQKATLRSIAGLLNCYCREFAVPRGDVQIDPPFGQHDWPQAIKHGIRQQHEQLMQIALPESKALILVQVTELKQLGQCRYVGMPYLRTHGHGWMRLDNRALAKVLLQHLSLVLQQPFNHELMEQIDNSVHNTALFLNHPFAGSTQRLRQDGFIRSEQGFIWGHAWHPTPKSREGIEDKQLLAISPESGAGFKLPLLAVHERLLQVLSSEYFKPLERLNGLTEATVPVGYQLLPCHPYQLTRFQSEPLFKAAVAAKQIILLGQSKNTWYPTSSVRTLYDPQSDFFLKFSLHVRLTNCVRKNAWYELESAIFITNLLKRFGASAGAYFPAFSLMAEPASVTINLHKWQPDADHEQVKTLSEAFGLLFRTAYGEGEVNQHQPRVAGALFADDEQFNSVMAGVIAALAKRRNISSVEASLLWFDAYVELLLRPIFYYFFKLGVIFEPHLQNTVIGFSDHLPSLIQLRDLEGTKLVEGKWSDQQLQGMSVRARQSVSYSREQGFKRIAYCALVNNLSEAIHHISGCDLDLEKRLWSMVKAEIIEYQQDFGTEPELEALLDGADIPCKCNFMTRLLKQADKQADYVYLQNPMRDKA